jgi:hypothetical protein
VHLVVAHVSGQLGLDGAQLSNPMGPSLCGDGLTVNGGLMCRAGFRATGELRLPRATIERQLAFGGSTLRNPDGIALNCAGLALDGDLLFDRPFAASGELRFTGAHVTGRIDLGDAVDAVVGGDFYAHAGFAATGEVRMVDARVAGQVNLSGATLRNLAGPALLADRVTVGGGLFCTGTQVTGAVRLSAAQITGELGLNGARLEMPDGVALDAQAVTVVGSLLAGDEFHALGEVRLTGAVVKGQCGFHDAHLENAGGTALNCAELQADSLWLDGSFKAEGTVSLGWARVRSLYDRPGHWPRLVLDGFVYDDLQPRTSAGGAAGRVAWLRSAEGGYRPQPYAQLSAHFRAIGQDEEARTVLLARERDRRARLSLPGRLLGYLLDVLVGYGYRPARAFGWLLLLLAAGSWFFALNPPAPVDPAHQPPYQPVLYTASLLIPLVNFGQGGVWRPAGAGQWVGAGLVTAGWVLATSVAAGITRVLTRSGG